MMSPKSVAFIGYLKKISQINFGAPNQKTAMSKTFSGKFESVEAF
jgi:hypothetical protein